MKIALTPLSTRARGVMLSATGYGFASTHIDSHVLKTVTKADIMSTPNCGAKTLSEIIAWAASLDIEFKGPATEPIYFSDENERSYTAKPPKSPHLTSKELAARWHSTPLTVTVNYRKLGLYPIRIGHRLLFPLKQIEDVERRSMSGVETPQPRPVGTAE